MEKLSKKRAAEVAGVSVYRLNKDIKNGRLEVLPSGGVCLKSLQKLYTVADETPEQRASEVSLGLSCASEPIAQEGDVASEPDPAYLRLIGKLEALLSLAERHRLMIEQQRRNISMLKTLNQRQEREIQFLRCALRGLKQAELQPWRRLFDRFSGPYRT